MTLVNPSFFNRLIQAGVCISLCSLCTVASAAHKTLDLRNASDASGEYSVSLCARASPDTVARLPGHAFVAYSVLPPGGQRSYVAVGFTTQSAVKGLLSYSALLARPAGYLGEETYSALSERCLVIQVNKPDFERAISVAQPFHAVPPLSSIRYQATYSLGSNDCMTFMQSVGELFTAKGFKVPVRKATELPLEYMRRMIDAN
jgi:hypothetical protein